MLLCELGQDHLELFFNKDKNVSVIQCTCSMFFVSDRAAMFSVAGPIQN